MFTEFNAEEVFKGFGGSEVVAEFVLFDVISENR